MSPPPLAFFDVDTQEDFMDPLGALYVPDAETIGPNVLRLVRAAARHGVRLFASVDAHAEDDPEFQEFPPHCVVGTDGQEKIPGTVLDDAVAVPPEPPLTEEQVQGVLGHPQIVFEKHSYDVFDNPNTERVLAASGLRRHAVFGVATDYCVRSVVVGLCERGYEVTVVEDAIKGIEAESTAAALDAMRAAGARFQSTDAVLDELKAEA